MPRAVLGGARDAGQEFLDAVHSLGMWSSENLGKLGIDLGKVRIDDNGIRWMEGTEGTKPIPLPEVKEPDTVSGGIYRDVAQFITGFLPALKGVKMAGVGTKATQAAQKYVPPLLGKHSDSLVKGAGKATEAMLAGAITEATVFDPYEERASDFVESIPALKNPVTDYLKADPEDHEAEARFKRSLEGLGFGALTEGVGLAFGRCALIG